MQLKNFELQGLYGLLMNLELSGKQSRMRTRFCKLIAERIQETETARYETVKLYANKDENGEPKTKKAGEAVIYDIPEDNTKVFNDECNELLNEEFVLIENEERIEMLRTVRDTILNVDMKFSGTDATIYDRWCEVFESIQ